MGINREDRLHFWISISAGRLPSNATFEQAYDFWYNKTKYGDIYDAVASIPYDRTFARTVRGIGKNPQKNQIVNEGKKYVASRLKKLQFEDADRFDNWHRECVFELIKIFKNGEQEFYVGQGQKWINMALKHLWLAEEQKIAEAIPFCHIPLDNYLYDAFTFSDMPEEFKDISLPFEPPKLPWSRINDYDVYLEFQRTFREKCKVAPLEYEFQLWQKQKDDRV